MMACSTNTYFSLFVGFLFFVVIIPTLQAEIVEYDDHWTVRQLQALININDSYHPNPEKVTKDFNYHVVRTLTELNNTRRDLTGNGLSGPCEATNPIDKCWRCDPKWVANRQKMADCAIGFGVGTTGGKKGKIYPVTSDLDDSVNPQPGTLRHAVIQKEPLWIIFEKNFVINLKQELVMTSDKTIDGRGADVHITGGAGITIQSSKNIIISNIQIHDIKPCNGGNIRDSVDHVGPRHKSDGDGVSIIGSSNIWLDHLSINKCGDGLIDANQGSTAITISNCHFTDHNAVILLGATDGEALDEKMQVTVAFNHFGKGCVQRMPRVRSGFFHVVNNDYTDWTIYCIGGGSNPTVISQGNRFSPTNSNSPKEVAQILISKTKEIHNSIIPKTIECPNVVKVTKRMCPNEDWKKWIWMSEGDVFEKETFFTPSGDPKAIKKFGDDLMVKFQPGSTVPMLTKDSGTLSCQPEKPC